MKSSCKICGDGTGDYCPDCEWHREWNMCKKCGSRLVMGNCFNMYCPKCKEKDEFQNSGMCVSCNQVGGDRCPACKNESGAMIEECEKQRSAILYKHKKNSPIPIDLGTDPINHPSHYLVGGIETLHFIKAKLAIEEYKGYLKGCIIKYLSRANHKGKALEDYRKAKFYLDELVKFTGDEAK